MRKRTLSGVMPAVTTPFNNEGGVNIDRLIDRCTWLLQNGCDGINILGTTGEGLSLSIHQRLTVMHAIAQSDLPLSRLMVNTGATALEDAQQLTKRAVELGYAGVLLLPPFYFKGLSEEGIINFVSCVMDHVDRHSCNLYLYHMPAYTGVPYTPEIALRLKDKYGGAIAGVKDSTGDLAVSDAFVARVPDFDVFPSAESSLDQAKTRGFAGCVSATVNVTAPLAGRFWRGERGANEALVAAAEIRKAIQGVPLLAGVKWMVARSTQDNEWNNMLPPIVPLSKAQVEQLAPVFEKFADDIKAA
ncbi:dihydrodipicolinate synthase family protein [Herbaspirillum sp. GCM10030257]|uniref:dihydrodipicolinate synthase family protein n=1 Tax=Herbaspirillum sp. GCM10030257 TaxID=3273393 RepID=UPI0036209557